MPYSIDKDAVEQMLAANPIQVLQRYAPDYAGRFLPARGRGPCPVHQGNDLNFRLSPIGWQCFSRCGTGGDLLDLCVRLSGRSFPEVLREWEGYSFRPTLPLVRERASLQPKPVDPLELLREEGMVPEEAAAVRRTVQQTLTLGPRGRAYLAGRRIDPDFAAEKGYRSVESQSDWYSVEDALSASYLSEVRRTAQLAAPLPRFCPAILLPHIGADGVSLVELRFRLLEAPTKGDRMRSLKGMQGATLSNSSYLHHGGEVHLCEGELDALTLEQLGLRAVGLPGAGNWRLLFADKEQLRAVSLLVLWFDGDETGRKEDLALRTRLDAEFGRDWTTERVRTVFVPAENGCKDVNDYHCRGKLGSFVGGAPWRN
jgi:hypothetical protein